jgi:hypothetical protein
MAKHDLEREPTRGPTKEVGQMEWPVLGACAQRSHIASRGGVYA